MRCDPRRPSKLIRSSVYRGVALACGHGVMFRVPLGAGEAMNDNWKGDLLAVGFRFGGIMLFIGGIIGGIFGPDYMLLHMLWVLMGICGFAMVMV